MKHSTPEMEYSTPDSTDIYQRMYEREKRARQGAEAIIEKKTREIYLANQELKRSNARLASASKAKSYFLRKIAHDFRTPLSWISLSLQLLEQDSAAESNLRSKTKSILTYCDELENQVSKLLKLFDMLDPSSRVHLSSYADIAESMRSFKSDISQSSHFKLRFQDASMKTDEALRFSVNSEALCFFIYQLCDDLLAAPIAASVSCEMAIDGKRNLVLKIVSDGFSDLRMSRNSLEALSATVDSATEQIISVESDPFEVLYHLARSNGWSIRGEGSSSIPESEYDTLYVSIPPFSENE